MQTTTTVGLRFIPPFSTSAVKALDVASLDSTTATARRVWWCCKALQGSRHQFELHPGRDFFLSPPFNRQVWPLPSIRNEHGKMNGLFDKDAEAMPVTTITRTGDITAITCPAVAEVVWDKDNARLVDTDVQYRHPLHRDMTTRREDDF